MNISKYLFFLSLINGVIYQTYAAPSSGPANPADIEQQQIIREQQRLKQFQEKMQPEVNVRLQPPQIEGTVNGLPQDEKPCFAIRSIKLNGDQAQRFQFALNKAINQSKFKPGLCLGSNGINYIMTLAQNAVIDRGYTTTRILASPQDLSTGELVLTVIPG